MADALYKTGAAAYVQEPCREFVWNLWLGASLTHAELPSVCPALLQVGPSGAVPECPPWFHRASEQEAVAI